MFYLGRVLQPVMLIIVCYMQHYVLHASNVRASLDQTHLAMGDSVTLSIEVDGDLEESIELPEVAGLVFSGSGTSSSISIVNGRMTKTVTYNFYLRAKRVGTFSIPAVKLRLKGKDQYTRSLTLKVTSAESFVADDGKEGTPTVFVKRFFSKQTVYRGEPVISTIKLYYRQNLSRVDGVPNDSEDFRYEGLKEEKKRERVGEHVYEVLELKRVLIPLKSGSFKLHPYQIQVGVVQERRQNNRSRDPFFGFFGGLSRQVVEKNIATDSDTIVVKEVPQDKRPKSYTGLVGQFDLKAELSATTLKVGETTTLTITIQGVGSLDSMKKIEPSFPDSVKVYVDKPELVEKADSQYGLLSKRTYKFALVPTKEGIISFDDVKQSYFDPKVGQFRQISSALEPLEVSASDDEAVVVTTKNGIDSQHLKTSVEALGSDLIDIHRHLDVNQKRVKAQVAFSLRLFAGGSFLLYLLFVLFDFFGASSASAEIKRKRLHAYKRYKSENSQINKGETTEDSVIQAVMKQYQLYRNFLGDKLNMNGASLTTREIEAQLLKIGIDKAQIATAHSLAVIMDKITFGKITINTEKGKTIKEDIDHLVGAIEKKC